MERRLKYKGAVCAVCTTYVVVHAAWCGVYLLAAVTANSMLEAYSVVIAIVGGVYVDGVF